MTDASAAIAVLGATMLFGLYAIVVLTFAYGPNPAQREILRKSGMSARHFAILGLIPLVVLSVVFVYGDPPRRGRGMELPLLVMLGGLYFVGRGTSFFGAYRLMKRTPVTPTGDVEPGVVEVAGEARLHEETTSPPRGNDALCYAYTMEEYDPYGGGQETFVTMAYEEDGVTFRVDDGTGPVLVDPDGATFRLEPGLANLGAGRGEEADEFERGDRRHELHAIEPGDPVHVLGTAVDRDGEPVIENASGRPFVVSYGCNESVAEELRTKIAGIAVGVVAVAVSAWWLLAVGDVL